MQALSLCVALGTANPLPAQGVITAYSEPVNAQPFALKDLQGSLHTLEDYRGKVLLVNFWASWCAPCLIEMPALQRLADSMKGHSFDILAISVSERERPVKRALQRADVDLTTLLDPDGRVFKAWQASMLPTSYLVDPGGRVRYRVEGVPDWDGAEVRSMIEDLLKIRTPKKGAAVETAAP